MDEFSDDDLTFASHAELSDLGNSQSITSQKLSTTSQKLEIASSVNNRHRLLNLVFNKWSQVTRLQKKSRIKKITFKKYTNQKNIFVFFNKWREYYEARQKLHLLGQSILMTKHFKMWKRIIEVQFDERKRFMRFLLIRRSIYEHQYFKEWKRSMCLAKRYKIAAKQSDSKIIFMAVTAFRINIKIHKQQHVLELSVQEVRNKFILISTFSKWKIKLRNIRLMRIIIRRHENLQKTIFFEKWEFSKRKQDTQARKTRAIRASCCRYLKKRMFLRWFSKYFDHYELKQKIDNINKMMHKRLYEIYFMKWISRFNENNYLSSSEQQLNDLIHGIKLSRSFGRWRTRYDMIRRKKDQTSDSENELRRRKLSRLFMNWRSKHALHNFEKIMLRKANRRLGKLYKRIFWNKWSTNLKHHRDDKDLNDNAKYFRELSLKLKTFNRFRIFREKSNCKKQKLCIAQAHYVHHLEKIAMISWKFSHRQTRRRFIMVSAVLKMWAYNIQQKKFRKWHEIVAQKKKRAQDTIEALQIYKRRCVSFAITSFVVSTRSLRVLSESDSENEDDLLKSDNEEQINEFAEIDIFQKEEEYHEGLRMNKLPSPKRPAFLGKKTNVYPMQHMISMVNAPLNLDKTQEQLKSQIESVIEKIQNCNDDDERSKLNQELKSLIDQINELLAQLP